MMLLGIVACVLMLIRTLPLNRTFALRSSKKLLSILLVQEEKNQVGMPDRVKWL